MPLYVPQQFPTGVALPQSGDWMPSSAPASAAVTAQSLTSGVIFFLPLDIGPVTRSFTNIGCSVTVAQSGGTATTTMGVYRDNGFGSLPNLVGGPIASGTVVLTATANRTVSCAWSGNGRWWMFFLYNQTAAPTTVATIQAYNGAFSPPAPYFSASAFSAVPRALQATVSSPPTTQIAVAAAGGQTVPAVFAQAA